MRVIAGKLRGTNLEAPKDNRGRPSKKETFEDEDMIMEMSLKVLELLKEKGK